MGEVRRNLIPERGWCFFFEKGEYRNDTSISRVVRVENHRSQDTKMSIYSQLLKHRGNKAGAYSGGGNHRLSLLRNHIGVSIMSNLALPCKTWEEGKANRTIRREEHWLETMVSETVSSMEVLVVPTEDGREWDRITKYVAQNAIALLSNFNKYPIDSPSPDWLGNFCTNALVRESGLWNTNGVMLKYDHRFLEIFRKIVCESKKCSYIINAICLPAVPLLMLYA